EIHVDLTPDLSGGPLVNADDPRVFEVWNLVFIQYNRDGEGKLSPLPASHVDTGMGFERLVTVLQNKTSNYDTDVFAPLLARLQELTGAPAYAATMPSDEPTDGEMRDISYRVVADHIRCLAFAIADGAQPDNEGRGYVLRRILRRAVRYGRQYLGVEGPFLHGLVPTLVDQMGDQFPELRDHGDRIAEVIHEEEESFGRTLDTGLKLFNAAADEAIAQGRRPIDGETAFKLHDTYGFPIDLTSIIAGERGLEVDLVGYDARMEEARERARGTGGDGAVDHARALVAAAGQLDGAVIDAAATDDGPKFETFDLTTSMTAWLDGEGALRRDPLTSESPCGVVLAATPFYAEQGGQVGDRGVLRSPTGRFRVDGTHRVRDMVLHVGTLESGGLEVGQDLEAEVDADRRRSIMSNHTATHLLNLGLREVLGDHVQQRGSLVDDAKTRFDFAHRSALTQGEIEAIETAVEKAIGDGLEVHDLEVPLERAQSIRGLRAVFGEKYPDQVRVVSVGAAVEHLLGEPDSDRWGDLSIELCGGTHVGNTGELGAFALTTEEAVAKGIRRVVGVTGAAAQSARSRAVELLERASALTSVEDEGALRSGLAELQAAVAGEVLPTLGRQRLLDHIGTLQAEAKTRQRAAAQQQGAKAQTRARALLDTALDAGDSKVIVGEVPNADADQLREALDWLRQKAGSAAVVLFATGGKKPVLFAGLTSDLVDGGLDARQILREAGKIVGGGGGGRPDLAQGGGKDAAKVPEAVEHLGGWLREQILS
ncbi:MAG: alanine--tRNA ligase, partial [Acidobacteriota bacterium]